MSWKLKANSKPAVASSSSVTLEELDAHASVSRARLRKRKSRDPPQESRVEKRRKCNGPSLLSSMLRECMAKRRTPRRLRFPRFPTPTLVRSSNLRFCMGAGQDEPVEAPFRQPATESAPERGCERYITNTRENVPDSTGFKRQIDPARQDDSAPSHPGRDYIEDSVVRRDSLAEVAVGTPKRVQRHKSFTQPQRCCFPSGTLPSFFPVVCFGRENMGPPCSAYELVAAFDEAGQGSAAKEERHITASGEVTPASATKESNERVSMLSDAHPIKEETNAPLMDQRPASDQGPQCPDPPSNSLDLPSETQCLDEFSFEAISEFEYGPLTPNVDVDPTESCAPLLPNDSIRTLPAVAPTSMQLDTSLEAFSLSPGFASLNSNLKVHTPPAALSPSPSSSCAWSLSPTVSRRTPRSPGSPGLVPSLTSSPSTTYEDSPPQTPAAYDGAPRDSIPSRKDVLGPQPALVRDDSPIFQEDLMCAGGDIAVASFHNSLYPPSSDPFASTFDSVGFDGFDDKSDDKFFQQLVQGGEFPAFVSSEWGV
ncbi:hypothetical protein FISHEDRAFT_73965 [Fistulina hepatica ATCC 64428]|uniref:Uncharacterized protein n=1 Tax=Fistulina hepatica ATCC 64428 TaxID=1128425 RepID=A0A0D7AE47_9AGAR|nr:hypothetical protein FISHEDRAFT_73965 [Fistulina hepatica ATCC 64428]